MSCDPCFPLREPSMIVLRFECCSASDPHREIAAILQASGLRVTQKVLSRCTFTSPSFSACPGWWEKASNWESPIRPGVSNHQPSGCDDKSNCITSQPRLRPHRRENIGRYFATRDALLLLATFHISIFAEIWTGCQGATFRPRSRFLSEFRI